MGVATTKLAAGLTWGTLSGHGATVFVSHIGLHSAATGGRQYAMEPIGGSTPYTVAVADGGGIVIPMNGYQITQIFAGTSVLDDTLALAILDAIFGHTTLGPATFYPRLWIVPPLQDGTGGTEFPTSGNYVTQVGLALFTNNTGNFPGAAII